MLNNLSPERTLSETDSSSSVSIWSPLTFFNIHLSEVTPFQLLMCSQMPPALNFSLKILFYVQVHLPEFRD